MKKYLYCGVCRKTYTFKEWGRAKEKCAWCGASRRKQVLWFYIRCRNPEYPEVPVEGKSYKVGDDCDCLYDARNW
jgi:hypothetical protein